MKVSQKVALVASTAVILTFSLFSWIQYTSVRSALYETADSNTRESGVALSYQITNWLNGKLGLIDMMAATIDADFSAENIQKTFDVPVLKKEFLLIFGGLATDGMRITNDPSWNPTGWDARLRPWYPYAQEHSRAVLTAPYPDAASGEILVSAVANLYDKGEFKGAFGGDLSLKTISDTLNTLNFNGAGYAFLLDESGAIISHPNAELNGQPLEALFTGRKPQLQDQLQELEVSGRTVLTRFSTLDDLYGSQWLIGIVLDKGKVMAAADEFGQRAVVVTLISVLLCSLTIYLLVGRLLRPLQSLRSSLSEMNSGDGDLTNRLAVQSRDEFGELSAEFNRFLEYLQGVIRDVKLLTKDIRTDTEQTASSANESSLRLEKQLAELDHLATAMHEMTTTAQDVAEHAQRTADSAQQADSAVDAGAQVVSRTTESIERLVVDMDDAVQTISELAGFSNNIESILTVITAISEQTNLLALNAAIEAARAGDAGRGFAVVADEVRALASRTQQSTEEIQRTIGQLQTGVRKAEQTISLSREMASQTNRSASEADQALSVIRDSIRQISDMTTHIATAAEQQSCTSEEINRNTTNIRDISQQVSDSASEQSVLCDKMVQLTTRQDATLDTFKV